MKKTIQNKDLGILRFQLRKGLLVTWDNVPALIIDWDRINQKIIVLSGLSFRESKHKVINLSHKVVSPLNAMSIANKKEVEEYFESIKKDKNKDFQKNIDNFWIKYDEVQN